ncbi:beta-glucosidase BglX [Chitinophaga sp. CB10]|uniref:beta-glucosidase BglX n=1 Tax=Chitinophaga sp. CB10 TaxID=1891659 RepID=UPI0025BDE975|nr:beta-glucosidase BglX [Chitinophaga sp. CB10]
MKKSIIVLAALCLTIHARAQQQQKMFAFVDQLLSKMTLEEKLGQLNLPVAGDFVTGSVMSSNVGQQIEQGKVGGLFNIKGVAKIREMQKAAVENSRLHIPLLFGMDVIHGYETTFPIPLGLSSTWDMELIEKSARIAATEASADGIAWTFSPMVDIARDPRWGRISEGSGEDAYLGSQIAKAMVRGFQGKDLRGKAAILACVKHFALYGAAEAGRDYNTVDMSPVRMYNEYLPPYQAAVEAGARSVMASFNEINGMPATANKWLINEVLRRQWKFDGFVVSDYTGISEMIQHGIGNYQQVSAKALDAGVDMDMVAEGFLKTLQKSLAEGKIKQAQIDTACRRILIAKYELGLFDDPYKYCDEQRAATEVFTAQHRKDARYIAAKSMVLLKNDNVLPLKQSGTVAVIGPLADSPENMFGTWSFPATKTNATSVIKGLKETMGDKVNFLYARGANFADSTLARNAMVYGGPSWDTRDDAAMLNEALSVAAKADVIVAALGESSEMSGESASRSDITIPHTQQKLLQALLQTGKPVVLLLFTGRPLALTWEQEHVPAILNAWFPGSEAGYAVADVLFGTVNPGGKLSVTFPKNVGQVPLYYNHKNTGRPLDGKWFAKYRSNYLDVDNDPLYPFGFGLSYTTFSYGGISLSQKQIKTGETLTATVKVTNTGKTAGEETVQLYIRDMVGSITRPVKELKGFKKVSLQPGESKDVRFTISVKDLQFYNSDLKLVAEPGDFKVFIGGNSRDVKEADFTLL